MVANQTAATSADSSRRGWSAGRIVGVVLTLSLVGFWMWAFSPFPTRGNPDRMSDRAFPAAAEVICVDARALIDALAPATTVNSLAERADLVDEGTTVLRVMVSELRTLTVDNVVEAAWVASWLGDYDSYIADRDRFTAQLRAGDDGAPAFTVSGAENVQTLIFGFAKVNGMRTCAAPGDI